MAQFEQLEDICRRPFGDPRAAPGQVFHQPLLGEQAQRLAQRRPAEAEGRAQLFFDDLLAGGELAAEDRLTQAVGRDLHQGRGQAEPGRVVARRSHGPMVGNDAAHGGSRDADGPDNCFAALPVRALEWTASRR